MSSVVDDMKDVKEKMALYDNILLSGYRSRQRRVSFKPPAWLVRKSRKQGHIVVLFLEANKNAVFKDGVLRDGRLLVGDVDYGFEPGAVYYYKKVPIMVVIEWRITPVGGDTEEFRFGFSGGESDESLAAGLKITNFAQQIIIRGIEASKLDDVKKKVKASWLLWLLLGVGAIYLLSKLFGG